MMTETVQGRDTAMDTTTDPELASGFVEKEQGDLDKSSNRLVALIMLALSVRSRIPNGSHTIH